MSEHRLPERDNPWVMRTYAGHSTAKESNELYRRNLAKGQTGLSVAFDLPTQTGYDPDHELSRGEVGKVGVSIAHKRDMHALLDGIPLNEMKECLPEIYALEAAKYQGREQVMEQNVPHLECLWNDVVFFSPLDPRIVFSRLEKSGYQFYRDRYEFSTDSTGGTGWASSWTTPASDPRWRMA